MCVVSLVIDHRYSEWQKSYPPLQSTTWPALPAQAELDEFRRLLDRAREYDKRNNEPDCEMADKKRKLLDLAKELGVDISFIEGETP